MFMSHKVYECDFNSIKYPNGVDGAWCISQGATGRWCPVMYCGPEYIKDNDITLMSEEEVLAQIKKEGGWPDF